MQLTSKELAVLELSAKLWNAFLELPIEHNDDQVEFRASIHRLQEKIFSRPVRRALQKPATDTLQPEAS